METARTRNPLLSVALWGSAVAAAVLGLVPVLDIVMARVFWKGFPEAGPLTEHALLALAFLAAALAGAQGKHLSLSHEPTGDGLPVRLARILKAASLSAVDCALLCASLSLLFVGFEPADTIFGLPKAAFAAPMSLGLLIMTASDIVRTVPGRPSSPSGEGRGSTGAGALVAALVGLLIGLVLSSGALLNVASAFGAYPEPMAALADIVATASSVAKAPLVVMLVVLAFMGLPLYAVISGAALLLFSGSYSAIELIPSEAYSLFKNDSMPAIPLFTLAGFVLSESKAGQRLVDVFREGFGWLPGGEAFAAVLVCAFFTTFTGANGVAILALGGILATILKGSGIYSEDFTHGFLTASSSVGLLFPPSMAVILYAVNATFVVQGEAAFTIMDMFLGGLLPGALFVLAMGAFGVSRGLRFKSERRRFDPKAALKASWKALPEIVIPVIILVMYLSGFANIAEIGAIILVYVAVVEGPVRKDLDARGLASALAKALPVSGGALIIIAAARGLSFYTMQAGLPELFTTWMTSVVSSRFVFLLFLNLALLVVGCFMDIFSAVLVISPLIIPLGAAYGVHPVHLGVIFIANLSIGFLTPPIGMNLFLASYAFGKPVMRIYKDVLPFFVAQLVVLVIITWVPWFSLAFLPGALG